MLETSARLLALLSLLQSRPDWTGPDLAARLGVSTRTIRTDIDRLRELGYPVDATRGRAGSYRLGAGGKLPPLLLDDEEAVAVAIGLRVAAGVTGIAETSERALAKLLQVLPSRLRPTVDALHATVDRGREDIDTDVPDPEVDAATLGAVARAIREAEWLRFDYDAAAQLVEPYRLLSWQRRWHLVARDPADGEWRTYRLDWIEPRMATHRRFTPTPLPGGDYTAFAMRSIAASGWKVHARLRVAASAESVLARINPTVGVVESVDASTSVLVTGADSLDTVAAYIGMLGMDFTVESPDELRAHLQRLSEVYARAARPPD
ncbi:helix-turn-helix transcriptional regulator [Microbacterium sp. CFBP9034]|uniref:helix-turn-helix transcriptional regulator n=1 Tax=Microbacterium sp. CFBP9034 TaxID=3096540 RepID=UPI002A6B6349|nr:WYL domain-containing protein [Microbacterium sp. CFBP9034]MDY0909210.1 WYL domain-containing protein [Microbacterium sp. CFBP9034]